MGNRYFLLLFFCFASFTSSIHGAQIAHKKEPEFVLAVFATHRSRANLLEKAANLNVLAYNVNWESKVDAKNNCIRNVWIRASGRWFRLKKVPLPDVIYDFGVYKNAQKKKERARQLKKELLDLSIPFINPEDSMAMAAVNDKVLFAKIMHSHQIPHPETYKYSEKNFAKLRKRHPVLFLKPIMGSKGYGIIIVEKMAENNFSLKYKVRDKKKKNWLRMNKQNIPKNKLHKTVREVMKELRLSRAPYLVQQGIDFFRYKNQPTDFRLIVQRGRYGALINSGLMMRVGGNLSQGGRPADYRLVLESFETNYGIKVESIRDQVANIAINTHIALEKFTKREIGDLGMDVVIDNDGNPYIIEANNKSGYASTYIKKNPAIEALYGLPPALKICEDKDSAHEDNLLEYARHLAAQKRAANPIPFIKL